ncbi:MAG: hypothetical protein ABSH05_14670 [Bryobacteraceae bacterium]|jgi:hypothetical protein
MRLSKLVPVLFLAALALPAQTLVEYSLGTARAAGSAAGMQGIGKATGALLDKAAKTLDTAAKPAGTVITIPKPGAAAAVKPSPPPDPAAIKIGMQGQEVVAKFGPPAMKVSSEEGETWSYGGGPDEVTLTFRDGKVSAVSPAARPKETKPQEVTVLQ